MQHEVIGKITKINPVTSGETKKGDAWKKVEFILQTDEDYNNIYPLEVFGVGENVSRVENFIKYNKVDNRVKVSFNVNSREYNEKYYVNLSAWRVDNQDSTNSSQSVVDEDDDMPF